MPSKLIIGSSDVRAHYTDQWENFTGGVCEIEEECDSKNNHLSTIREDDAFDFRRERDRVEDGVVYVAVGKQGSADHDRTTMAALTWALKNAAVHPSSVVVLVHVFPEVKYIPTPLGNLPIKHVNPDQKEVYMAQQAIKRRDFLHSFLKLCYDSQYRKGNGVVDQIVQGAPEFCEVKIICDGKEMSELMMESSSSNSSSPRSTTTTDRTPRFGREKEEQTRLDSASCGCFKL